MSTVTYKPTWKYYKYRQLDSIKFSGVDEYFDFNNSYTTPLIFNEIRLKAKQNNTPTSTNLYGWIGFSNGSLIAAEDNSLGFGSNYYDSAAHLKAFPSSASDTTSEMAFNDAIHNVKIINNGSDSFTIELWNSSWNTRQVQYTATYANAYDLWLGALHLRYSFLDSIVNKPANFTNLTVYEVKVFLSGGDTVTYTPCQRKVDGVCGLYCDYTDTFIPMKGTSITDSAAGNVVLENYK